MKRAVILILALTLILATQALAGEKTITMSTTTSTQASGLLDELLPAFTKDTGISVKVVAKGTGAAIRDGVDGNADVIFVHARGREEAFVKDGYGTMRFSVMHNDFVILGPPSDPAGIKGMTDAAAALKKIAAAGIPFVSRGDDSGTHTKEQALWKASGVALETQTTAIVKKGKEAKITFVHPKGLGKWYLSIGQGMGKAINFADQKKGYVLSDRGTFIKYKYGNSNPVDLIVLCEGDDKLFNPYGMIPINPARHPHTKYKEAMALCAWITSVQGQRAINDYRLLNKQLFMPDVVTDFYK